MPFPPDAADHPDPAPLRDFVAAMTRLVATPRPEAALLAEARPLLAALVARDDWLPPALARPHPDHYLQYLLHADPLERFSVVSFVWGPGQSTPVHDHTVWGLIGMLRGEEIAEPYRCERAADGAERAGPDRTERAVPDGPPRRLRPGQVEVVSPTLGDLHRVRNALDDAVSISIHVYGANIGAVRRHVYPEAGGRRPFVSGYSNDWVPNLWDRSRDAPKPR